MNQPVPKKEKLAFVLSGGGSLGSMQVGCLISNFNLTIITSSDI